MSRHQVGAEKKTKRQKNGNVHHYVYYHCTKRKKTDVPCSQSSIREQELEAQIASELKSLEIPPEFHSWAMKQLQSMNEKEAKSRQKIYDSNKRAYERTVRKIDNLIDMRANGENTEREYQPRKREAEEERNPSKPKK